MTLSIDDLTERDIAKTIDHSLLRPELDDAFVEDGCRLAAKYDVASVCVRPADVRRAKAILAGTDVAVGTTIGFPHGNHTTEIKVVEARRALADGATELDMVINISAAVSEDFNYLREEIRVLLAEAHDNDAKLKVIFENCYLTDIQKIRLCEICVELGVDWVKTSTGFGSTGATVKDVTMMVHRCAPSVQVKAAGGIRDLRSVLMFHQLGCTRIGCSRTADVLAYCAG